MSDQDTICAVSTPPGAGGIGIIRISGRDAIRIASHVVRPRRDKRLDDEPTHSLLYGHVVDPVSSEPVDEVLVSIMRAPATYTREDVVEINCHGGTMPLWRTMDLLIAAGARMAEPGEFTRRAFLNGRIDLTQAEAVMDIIRSKTELSHRAANEQLLGGLAQEIAALRDRMIALIATVEASIDFPDEDIETETTQSLATKVDMLITGIDRLLSSFTHGRILRDGFATAIVGKPNVGKSSLLNALLRQNRAIVTDVPGTTRDVLEEYLNIAGVPLKILDTAGIRHSHDLVEQEGVRRSIAAIESADFVMVMLDGSRPITEEDGRVLDEVRGKCSILIINKADLPRRLEKLDQLDQPVDQVSLSCMTGEGISDLKAKISSIVQLGTSGSREHAWAVNKRHKTALEQTKESLRKAIESIQSNLSPEFIAVDLRGALDSLGLISGTTCTEDILERIFNDFCIGK